jgi:ectoine hydroxylase-related dioxygenase (phytanoyl-CoA dioxygenase family)
MALIASLPTLDDTYTLSKDCVRSFRRDGHTLVRGLMSAEEVASWRPVIERAALGHRRDARPLAERDTYGKAFIQTTNLWRRDPTIAGFSLSRRFARVGAALMGVDGVRMYHDQALLKEPGGGPTPWHQDRTYWPLDTPNTVTMWMALVDIPEAVGTMRFVSGSQRMGDLGTAGIGDHSESRFASLIAERGLRVDTHGAISAGDATFHSGWTLHSAGPNPTDAMRSVMTVIYYADGTRVAPIRYEAQAHDLKRWLAGCEPGDLALGPDNPLLYSAVDDA